MPETAVIREYLPSDAAEVARMWNESDQMWPGGFTGGVPMTGERFDADLRRSRYIALYLAVVEGRVAGYCRLVESREEDRVAYIALLNVHPAFQKRGYARDLLRRSLERTMQGGYDRLDLHTWAGNMLAVPLYKKSGYFWVPDTSVHMENYLPLLLRTPFLADFFATHDWYATQTRDLSVQEDDVTIGNTHVYPYRWDADGLTYEATIDAESKGLTALRTPEWRIACRAPNFRVHRGIPQKIQWEVERLSSGPGGVTLIADGDPGLRLHHEAQATVDGVFTTETSVSVDADVDVKPHGLPSHAIRTTLVLDGTVVHLRTAQRVGPAVELVQTPRFWTVPRLSTPLRLRLRNHLDIAIDGTLQLTPAPGAHIAERSLPFSAPANGYAGVKTDVTLDNPGLNAVQAALSLSGESVATTFSLDPLQLPACAPGQAVVGVGNDQATIENDSVLLTVQIRGAWWSLASKRKEDLKYQGTALLGQPFDGAQRQRLRYQASSTTVDGMPALVLAAPAWGYPGLRIERIFQMLSDEVLRVRTVVTHAGDQPVTLRVLHVLNGWPINDPTFAIPLEVGLLVDRAPFFPDWQSDAMELPSVVQESWFALGTSAGTVGVFWEDVSRIEIGRTLELTSNEIVLDPGESTAFPDVHVVMTLGDWQVVRGHWRTLRAPSAPESLGTPHRAFEVTTTNSAPLTPGRERVLEVVSRYAKSFPLSLSCHAPPGWDVQTADLETDTTLEQDQPRRALLSVSRHDGGALVAPLCVEVTAGPLKRTFTVPLLDPGEGNVTTGQEQLMERPIQYVASESLRLCIAPSIGAAVRLQWRGANQLLSPFPQTREYQWFKPWYGGLAPFVFLDGLERWEGFPEPGMLPLQQWSVDEATERGASGTLWKGVALHTRPRSTGYLGLEVRATWLLAPSAPLIVLRLQIHNDTTALLRGTTGWNAYLQPGGRRNARLVYGETTRWVHTRGVQSTIRGSGRWAAVHDPEVGVVIALISPLPLTTTAHDAREEGMHLSSVDHRFQLEGGATTTYTAWLLLGDSLKELDQGSVLGDVVNLP